MKYLITTVLLLTSFIANSAEQKQPPCSSEEYRQFDFWMGEWEVFNPKGKKVGENKIEKILGGCSLQENWRGASGNIGHSYNIYDRTKKQWHQTWVDNTGTLLELNGGKEGDSMVMSGVTKGKGGDVMNTISWTPNGDTVRQVWSVSTDNGESWKVIFDGLYKKKAGES
ncbi:hypothetical protein [Kangiella geojedonensis]|uniref:TPR repeat-containing protein n=1 Tax=Kangiella geojedonensis TaxID=914150 RepID=A0A0F6RD50_9GAMM|nr:hypothetical protein [Kangiella geojedonensis]AKE52978.1 TPR repeat-containing protein [Kangiella geojedonensis]